MTKIFHGGDIVTLDPQRPAAEAVAIEGEKIIAVGSLAELSAGFPSADRVDLAGGCLIPSLKDHHLHLTAVGLALLNREENERLFLDLAGAASADDIVQRVAERASRLPNGEWVLGMGWNQHDWGTHVLPVHDALSRAVPDNPVFLVRVDAHSAWINAAAMRVAGIDRGRSPAGGRILRHPGGQPSGILLERAVEPVLDHIPVTAGWEMREAFRRAADALAAGGVTEVFDAGFMAGPAMVSMSVDFEVYLELLASADAEEPLPVDVNLMVPAPSPLARKILDDPDAYRELSDRVRVTHIKLYADGAFGSRGAALSHPYADDPSTSGLMRMTDEEMEAETRGAIDAGLDISTHAIGDDAVRRVLSVYEKVAAGAAGVDPARFRIEHFAYASEEDIRRGADSGFVLVAQPNFVDPDDGGVAMEDHRLGADAGARVYPWKTLLELGAQLAFSSDYYVAPGPPLLDFYAACSRANRDGLPGRGWQPAQRLSRIDSLRLATALRPAGGGPATGGILRDGAPADLAILSANPLTVSQCDMLRIDVLETYHKGFPSYQVSKRNKY